VNGTSLLGQALAGNPADPCNNVPLAAMGRPAASALWARDHSRSVAQARGGQAVFADQHFSDAEAGGAVHPFRFLAGRAPAGAAKVKYLECPKNVPARRPPQRRHRGPRAPSRLIAGRSGTQTQ
jgi:hypothetical protein